MDKDQQQTEQREPDNTVTMHINGTKYIIREYLGSKNNINNIIAGRVLNDLDPSFSSIPAKVI
jgi:hypothetical protein